MFVEIHCASEFLLKLMKLKTDSCGVADSYLSSFQNELEFALFQRYQGHWFVEDPSKGSGYRCLRINGCMDPIIQAAASIVGLSVRHLRILLPPEITLWIDPEEVAYRIGEDIGSVCTLYNRHSLEGSPDLDSPPSISQMCEYNLHCFPDAYLSASPAKSQSSDSTYNCQTPPSDSIYSPNPVASFYRMPVYPAHWDN